LGENEFANGELWDGEVAALSRNELLEGNTPLGGNALLGIALLGSELLGSAPAGSAPAGSAPVGKIGLGLGVETDGNGGPFPKIPFPGRVGTPNVAIGGGLEKGDNDGSIGSGVVSWAVASGAVARVGGKPLAPVNAGGSARACDSACSRSFA